MVTRSPQIFGIIPVSDLADITEQQSTSDELGIARALGILPDGLSVRTIAQARSCGKSGWEEMTYRISYEDGWTDTGANRTEYFGTEHEALRRARELIDSGVHHGVSVRDSSDGALAGLLLQLKLGASAVD